LLAVLQAVNVTGNGAVAQLLVVVSAVKQATGFGTIVTALSYLFNPPHPALFMATTVISY
jgi:hypothetical protein